MQPFVNAVVRTLKWMSGATPEDIMAAVPPDFYATGWQVVVAPLGTPQPIIDKVSADLIKVMGDPELIMIDEPTEGLAPLIVHQVGDLIAEIARRGLAILLVEQKLSIAMRISHRLYIMGHGRIVFEGTPADLRDNQAVRKEWLEV